MGFGVCDGPTLSSDPPYPWGTGRAELPDPEVLGTGTNPEDLPGEDGQKRNSTLRPEAAGGRAREEQNAKGEDSNSGSGRNDVDGPADRARTGRHRDHQSPSERREDQEVILLTPATLWEERGLRRCVGRVKQD
ncbi:hypothetical protein NDU88_002507 [Pleurodeles waltl]|uniref:Uncharacterized protein n=1 Tax=Pleurodeles waltl TaxID=8319 RepID=A0AAV7TLV2_PLEWA|nr:hypothetical protein NDU88_002507 [Pleurodeles waltl]